MENVMNRSFHLPEFRTEVSTRHGMFAACYNKVTDSMSQNIMLQKTHNINPLKPTVAILVQL